MEVEAFSQKISNVFGKGQFIIPDYQREYDWDEAEIQELLDDIEEIGEEESYFIGHMVFEGKFTGTSFNVIDGQQRITTITILLSVIRDLFYLLKLDNLGNGINNNYIFKKDLNDKEYVVLENKMPYPVLQAYVQSKPVDKDLKVQAVKIGEKKIVKAYDTFYEMFKSYDEEKLKKLRNKILNLEVIFVAASEKVDAHTIFMTLNATGKDLTSIDLMKNQIFSFYPKLPHIDEPNDSWKKIIANTEDKGIKFFNNFWSSRYKKISDSSLFKQFIKTIVKPKKDIKIFLKDLVEDSILFRKLYSPQLEDWSKNNEYLVYLSLNAITQIFSIEVANSILISLLREYEKNNISLVYLIKALDTLERFHFINNAICSNRSSGLDIMYAKHSRELLIATDRHGKHNVIDELITKLTAKIPSFEAFDASFDSKLFYLSNQTKQKKLVQYVLNKIEFKKQNQNVDLINMSIEHIYPEKPKASVWSSINPVFIKNIGNLVLLDAGLNSNVGNLDYNKKKAEVLASSSLISTKEVFTANNTWDELTIKNRRTNLISVLYKDVWI
jgi:uncharacterized protein with ParB-like and HNH nuclease domain